MWKHWVARTITPYEPFNDFETARWFWDRIAFGFPMMVSGVLMPNHLHLILPREINANRKLSGLLAATGVRCGVENLWQLTPLPVDVTHSSLRRVIRYVALNPCRKQLCRDPLEWYWSSYRDLMGASAQTAQSAGSLARILREQPRGFEVRFHSYVSGDPSVSVHGTPFPRAAVPSQFATHSLSDILAAACGALRMKPDRVRGRGPLRPLFLHSARRHGWVQTSLLAQVCGISPSAVRYTFLESPPAGIEATDLCLGDPRLRKVGPAVEFLKNVSASDFTKSVKKCGN